MSKESPSKAMSDPRKAASSGPWIAVVRRHDVPVRSKMYTAPDSNPKRPEARAGALTTSVSPSNASTDPNPSAPPPG